MKLSITNRHDSACRTVTLWGGDLAHVLQQAAEVARTEMRNPWLVQVVYDDEDGEDVALMLDNHGAKTSRRALALFDAASTGGGGA